MSNVVHPNIVQYLGVCEFRTFGLCVITEWAPCSLEDILRDPEGAPELSHKLEFINQIRIALDYLHSHGAVHGRLSPTNCWVLPRLNLILNS